MTLDCFKAYDIRGRLPDQINPDIAWRIGRAYATWLGAHRVAVGYDVRLSSPELAAALGRGLEDSGSDVIDLGLCGTEEIYFAAAHYQVNGGIMVTASHNPADYNGLKLVREQAKPISGDSGLQHIHEIAENQKFTKPLRRGGYRALPDKSPYIAHLLSYIEADQLQPLRIVVNAGNGCAGPIIDALEPHLPLHFIKLHHQPDGHFPNGIPNPLLPENRAVTSAAVVEHHADFGLAWDGDFDRCFFFDHQGRFIEGYYLVGLLAETLLAEHPGGRIIHDPRLSWNTIEMVQAAGGIPVQSKTGHAFIKERMRTEDAIYGGEMSAHHYFRRFAYCDSGMIPWLLIAALISRSGRSLAELVDARITRYPCSGEINFTVADPQAMLERVLEYYTSAQPTLDYTDGLSAEFSDWRFNLRSSNTEPLLRLNIETRADPILLAEKTAELRGLLTTM